jgi:exosortase D (VPLPA-CTERM-specific)
MIDASIAAPAGVPPVVFRLTFLGWLLPALALIAVALAERTGLMQMLMWLLTRPEYSHGVIIPFVAAFLVWQRRDRIEQLPFVGTWFGVWLALFGLLLGALGKLSAVFTLEDYSIVIVLYGLVLALTGWRVFRLLWVPLLTLIFMVPLPEFLYENFSAELQLLSSRIGVWLMRLAGVSVYLEGNVIDLGTYKLQVAEACSGLRYLFPLMTIGFLIAYFFKAALWKRILVFASSVPITIFMNSFRVGTIGVLVEHWGVGMAEGFLHEFQGWLIFMVSAALMIAEVMILARVGSDRRPWREQFGLEFPAPKPKDRERAPRSVPGTLYAAAAVLILLSAASMSLPERAEAFPERATFASYPRTVGYWAAHRETLEPVYLDTLLLDDYYLADFTRGSDPAINLYVAWYGSQRAGRSAHSPRSCLPGGGWQIQSLTQRTLAGAYAGESPLRVNRAMIQFGSQRQLVYYWFQQRGRVITNEYAAKWYLFWDGLTRNRTDGALVRLVVSLPPGGSVESADRELTEFAAAATSTLSPFIPN